MVFISIKIAKIKNIKKKMVKAEKSTINKLVK